jgi:hypothetical protein
VSESAFLQLVDSARALIGRVSGFFWPGATVANGILIPPPGDPADTHYHYVSAFASTSPRLSRRFRASVISTWLSRRYRRLRPRFTVPETITVECIGAGGFTSVATIPVPTVDLTLKGAFISEPVQRFQGSVSVKFVSSDSDTRPTRRSRGSMSNGGTMRLTTRTIARGLHSALSTR